MSATLIFSGHLRDQVGGRNEITVESGQTIRATLTRMKVPPEIVALVVINGVHTTDKDTILNDGDVVKLLAVIGGG
jgi:sulfur carrier protein ThiS